MKTKKILKILSYYEKEKTARLLLDLKPALSEEQLDKRVLRDFEDGLNKQFKNVLGGLFPSKLIPVMVKLSGIDPEKPVNEITRQERLDFVKLIKNLPMEITGTRSFVITIGFNKQQLLPEKPLQLVWTRTGDDGITEKEGIVLRGRGSGCGYRDRRL